MIIPIFDKVYDFTTIVFIGNEYFEWENVKKPLFKLLKFKNKDLKKGFTEFMFSGFPVKSEARTFHYKDVNVIIMPSNSETSGWYGTLAHEVFHVTHFSLEYIGANLCEETKEQFAYYNGFLHTQILNQLWKKKK